LRPRQAVDDTVAVIANVQLAGLVLAERADGEAGGEKQGALPMIAAAGQGPGQAAAIVAKHIYPVQLWQAGPAIDVAAGHGAAAFRVAVLRHRRDQVGAGWRLA